MLLTTNNYSEIAEKISKHVKNNAALISIAEHTEINIEELIKELNHNNIKFMGGIFPKVIHGNTILDKGIVLNTLANVESMFVIENISSKIFKIPQVDFRSEQDYSLFTYVDGLTSNISNYLERLYESYGMQTNYFGGGAGSLSFEQKPCLFNNQGFYEDAAIACVMRMKSNIGVKHGWGKISGPYIVTSAEGNIIKEINWKNAFEVYKEAVEAHSEKKFTQENFFEIAKGYPFGIIKDDEEYIVRDPLEVDENNELVCVGELEDNMLVDILIGDKDSLIKASQVATENCIKQSKNPKKAIIIDCISRILFLEDKFEAEISSITGAIHEKYPNISIGGALTLGEISSYGEGFLEFYNKTVVVGLFEYEN